MKVLVLGAGGAASNGFARALKIAGGYDLVGTNSSPTDILLSECDTNHLVANVSDLDQWRDDLRCIIEAEAPGFVHAQNDAEVEALGGLRNVVHQLGAKTYLPSQPVIELCRDKWLSYEAWRAAGVPVPYTRLVKTPTDITAQLCHGPIWMRPRVGAGGQKSLRTADGSLANGWWRQHRTTEFTIAEVLTPDTVTVQQLYWKGQLVCSQQRTRESWANAGSTTTGVSGSTGVGVTSSDPEADRVADAAVTAVDSAPHGLYGVDMCRRRDGQPCVTELNIGRFFTTAPEFFARASERMLPNVSYIGNMAHVYAMIAAVPRSKSDTTEQPPHYGPDVWNPLTDGLRWIRGMDRSPVLV